MGAWPLAGRSLGMPSACTDSWVVPEGPCTDCLVNPAIHERRYDARPMRRARRQGWNLGLTIYPDSQRSPSRSLSRRSRAVASSRTSCFSLADSDSNVEHEPSKIRSFTPVASPTAYRQPAASRVLMTDVATVHRRSWSRSDAVGRLELGAGFRGMSRNVASEDPRAYRLCAAD